MLYKVYVDRTDDGIPFYVGKGKQNRVSGRQRNKKHTNVAAKHGFHRSIEFETDDETEAHAKEVEWIAEYKTFYYDYPESSFSCNFTRGGEGTSGVTPKFTVEHRKHISENRKTELCRAFEIDYEVALSRLRSGETRKMVADAYRVSLAAVDRLLRKHGVILRPRKS